MKNLPACFRPSSFCHLHVLAHLSCILTLHLEYICCSLVAYVPLSFIFEAGFSNYLSSNCVNNPSDAIQQLFVIHLSAESDHRVAKPNQKIQLPGDPVWRTFTLISSLEAVDDQPNQKWVHHQQFCRSNPTHPSAQPLRTT